MSGLLVNLAVAGATFAAFPVLYYGWQLPGAIKYAVYTHRWKKPLFLATLGSITFIIGIMFASDHILWRDTTGLHYFFHQIPERVCWNVVTSVTAGVFWACSFLSFAGRRFKHWRLCLPEKPEGALYEAITDGGVIVMKQPSSVRVKIPIDLHYKPSEISSFVEQLVNLRAGVLRALEVEWDRNEELFRIWLTAEKGDLPAFVEAFRSVFKVDVEEGPVENYAPAWLKEIDDSAVFFDAELRHGHSYIILNTQKSGSLLTSLLTTLTGAEYAFLQIVWTHVPVHSWLIKLKEKGEGKKRVVETPRVKVRKNASGRWVYARIPHWEKISDFTQAHNLLSKHLLEKAAKPTLIVSVRGVIHGGSLKAEELPFAIVDELPFAIVEGPIGRVMEHLEPYGYPATPSLLRLLHTRAVPKPNKHLKKHVKRYWTYLPRQPLPFLILLPQELGLFVHLPDPNRLAERLETTRAPTKYLPPLQRRIEQEGLNLWEKKH